MKSQQSPLPEQKTSTDDSRQSFTTMRGVQMIVSVAVLMATLFTLWNPRSVFRTPSLSEMLAQQTSETSLRVSQDRQIGLLAGYWRSERGKVCADGVREEQITLAVAERTAVLLNTAGYQVDIFEENDVDLLNYKGVALVAIMPRMRQPTLLLADFSLQPSLNLLFPINQHLAVCMAEKYANTTGLSFVPDYSSRSAAFRTFPAS